MIDWFTKILGTGELSVTMISASFVAGIAGFLMSCCNLAVIGAVIGFAGSENSSAKNRTLIFNSIAFMAGTILILALMGVLTGLISKVIGSMVGNYWKIAAGLVAIFFGLSTLKIVPVKLPSFGVEKNYQGSGIISSFVFGLAIGGLSSGCNLLCNPVFPLVLSAAFLKGSVLWGLVVMVVFGAGYALLPSVAMAGISLGLKSIAGYAAKTAKYISWLAGSVLILVGFYLLLTF
ncbi:MAG: sulfite exporter TauE/SafE family protein [Bacteroidia bacterium]|nr:sulfite exporter TauE/SafE family protein [Bacteroidia bacterium]